MKIKPPVRVRRTYVQRLEASPEEVFPLLCPVREAEWVQGWEPKTVYSASGVAEPGCIFLTPGDSGGADAVWVVLEHDPERRRVAMLKVTPGLTSTRLEIELEPDGDGGTAARVTYEPTALSRKGERAVAAFTDEYYRGFMERWERELNHFLAHGEKLAAD